jgi:phosphotransacetylase
MITSFDDLGAVALAGGRRRYAVPGAADEHALEAVFAAADGGYVEPVLIGQPAAIAALIERLGLSGEHRSVACTEGENPAAVAVRLVRAGEADFILKGHLQTRDLMKPILDKSTGLNDSGFITHFGLMRIAGYHKLLAMSYSAIIPYPDLAAKKKIVAAGVAALHTIGFARPIVAALAAVEVVNPKMPETVDAAALVRRPRPGSSATPWSWGRSPTTSPRRRNRPGSRSTTPPTPATPTCCSCPKWWPATSCRRSGTRTPAIPSPAASSAPVCPWG